METKDNNWIEVNYDLKNLPIDDKILYNLELKGNQIRYNMSLYELKVAFNFELLVKYQTA